MSRIVPTYDVLELAPRRHRYALCIPVINEGARIQSQLRRLRADPPAADIIIADGGSTDGSLEPGFLTGMGVTARLTKTGPGKLGAQMRMAFDHALNGGYDGVILMDGNDKDEPGEVARFVAALDDGVDFAQGSRFVRGGRHINNPRSRLIGIVLIHAPVLSVASRFRYTDTTNGFRAYSRRFLTDERVALFRDVFAGYELHYYLSLKAARLGFRVVEVPVTRTYPTEGPTPTKISPIKGNLKVLKALADVCLGRYDP